MKIPKLFAMTALLAWVGAAPAMAQTDVHVLDVGQGLSILIHSDGHYMLYDGGDSHKSSYVVSYLKQQNVPSLDCVVASHYDSDHLNGVVGVLNVFPTKQVWGPDYTTDTRVFRSFQNIVAEKEIEKILPSVGSTWQLGDASIQVLAPGSHRYSDVNDYSIAIRITDGNTSFLVTGDAEAESETEMVASGLDLSCDVYVMGHHGSGTSTTWELLQKAVPEYAIASCGLGNSYGHPHAESMEKLQDMDISLFRTDLQGVIIASTDGNTITWNTEPCNDYTPGDSSDVTAQPQQAKTETPGISPQEFDGYTMIVNTNTRKYHAPSCSSVKDMKAKNTGYSNDLAYLDANDYTPCKRCH